VKGDAKAAVAAAGNSVAAQWADWKAKTVDAKKAIDAIASMQESVDVTAKSP